MTRGDEKEPIVACGLGVLGQPDLFGEAQVGAQLFGEHQKRAFRHHLGQRSLGLDIADEEVDARGSAHEAVIESEGSIGLPSMSATRSSVQARLPAYSARASTRSDPILSKRVSNSASSTLPT